MMATGIFTTKGSIVISGMSYNKALVQTKTELRFVYAAQLDR